MSDGMSESGVQPSVTVLGEAAIRTEPDEAIVWITLSATHPTPGSALADVARRSDALREMLDELEIATEDRSTTGVTVSQDFDHTPEGRRLLGHEAVASVSIRLADNDRIGRLMMRASEELDARINGPRWQISASNPAWLEAATRAAANAKAKASAYAAGVEAQLGPLIKLWEPEHGRQFIALAASRRSAPNMDIDSGEQEVIATVNATFALHST